MLSIHLVDWVLLMVFSSSGWQMMVFTVGFTLHSGCVSCPHQANIILLKDSRTPTKIGVNCVNQPSDLTSEQIVMTQVFLASFAVCSTSDVVRPFVML